MFNLSVEGIIWRFYLLMLVVIISFFSGYGIFALIALPILLSAMFGIRFKYSRKEEIQTVKEKEKSTSAVAE